MINFWNGNKSPARQAYELALLQSALNESNASSVCIFNDPTDYPKAEDEGNIFDNGCDVLATIVGNKKFANKPFIEIKQPLCKGLLGQRILIIRDQDSDKFSNISEEKLKQLVAGIPATWVDADLFRANQYQVLEQGSLQDILQLLKEGKCDYVSLGANEIQSLFAEFAAPLNGLMIERSMTLCYPFPLVFYTHTDKIQLASDIESGLASMIENDKFDKLFDLHYGVVVKSLMLKQRKVISLINPNLPA